MKIEFHSKIEISKNFQIVSGGVKYLQTHRRCGGTGGHGCRGGQAAFPVDRGCLDCQAAWRWQYGGSYFRHTIALSH